MKSAKILAALLRDGGLLAYSAACLIGAPVFLWRKWRRMRHHGFTFEFDPARWSIDFPEAATPSLSERENSKKGPRVAIIADGWGEVATIAPLARALRQARPDARLVFTVMEREAIETASRLTDEEVLPKPFDNVWAVARWHARARPDLVVFYEKFNYSALIRSLWVQRVPFVIVHARLSIKRANEGSSPSVKFKRWQLRGLRAITLTTPDYLPNVENLAPATAQSHVVGSIKFPHQRPPFDAAKEASLRVWIETNAGAAPLLVAGSTHPDEENWVLEAFQIVRENWSHEGPPPVLLLAPRRPKRADEIAQLVEQRGLRLARRSQMHQERSGASIDILLLDTLGELLTVYRWASGIFVGGSIFSGSQNVTEPLVWSKPVAYGPKSGNFAVEQNLCEAAGVGFRVHTPAELAAHWTWLLDSPDLRRALGEKADALLAAQNQAFARTLQILVDAVDAADARQSG